VIIVTACDGDMWASPDQGPGRRLGELRASAAILGADKAVHLAYADSGHGPVLFDDPPGRTRFARADVAEAAVKLAALLAAERADLLLSYDPQGGCGHRDHVRVHQVGARAAELAGVPVAEATVPARVGRIGGCRDGEAVCPCSCAAARNAGTMNAHRHIPGDHRQRQDRPGPHYMAVPGTADVTRCGHGG